MVFSELPLLMDRRKAVVSWKTASEMCKCVKGIGNIYIKKKKPEFLLLIWSKFTSWISDLVMETSESPLKVL